MPTSFNTLLEVFAEAITEKFTTLGRFNPEDQLKTPVDDFFRAIGSSLGLTITTATEMQIEEIGGRPDFGIFVNGLLCGHIELKRPSKGANPAKFSGRDKEQWQKFQDLPNLIYTDANEWALYRNGQRQGKLVRLSGDTTSEGKDAVSASDAANLFPLIQDFLNWQPIVPHSPRALAEMLAPLCRLLRADVIAMLNDTTTGFTLLADEWRKYFFPDADDHQFADAYAQTITYSLLLAQLQGATAPLTITQAANIIRPAHKLLADALNILTHPTARKLVDIPITLLERLIGAIDPLALRKKSQGDPWLYFYEDFLAAYDAKLRKDRGVYYTPVEVVQAQVRLVADLLANHFDADYSFADPNVVTLDPATGTGTYITAVLEHGLNQVAQTKGPGMRANYATQAAQNIHGFELLVGPYAVAHMRFTQQIQAEGGTLPANGTHVYLADTLDSPNQPPPPFPFAYKELAEEHKKAQQVKANTPVLVCIGNPPYDRQQIKAEDQDTVKRKGGWVRFGDKADNSDAILLDFLKPLEPLGYGVHAKNLYNDYVYFWRWALWKVFANKDKGGIVSFITASSYLRGTGFAGMRQVMRQTFDELWIIDLEGDNLGARKTENVFTIRSPVCIATGIRYSKSQPNIPAKVHYVRLDGSSNQKLQALANIHTFTDLTWRDCLSGWTDEFLPTSSKPYWNWPLITDLFPWQENGIQFKRTWPISESSNVVLTRWQTLLQATKTDQQKLLRETEACTTKKIHKTLDKIHTLTAISELKSETPTTPIQYAYRSFDRQWAIQDVRLCDRPRPELQLAHGEQQIYLTSLLTNVIGNGSSAVVTSLLPDLHHFCGRGAKDIIPLWRNKTADSANVVTGLLPILAQTYSTSVSPEAFLAYTYAILSSPNYAQRFWDELTIPGPRLPVTKNGALFAKAVAVGERLIYLHTYGERCIPLGKKRGKVPPGRARCKVGTPSTPKKYPDSFHYDAANQELHIGEGVFEHVRPEIWAFSVSGLEVIKSWLGYRMKDRKGKKSSPLDDIRPERWVFDDELLDLLWILDGTIDLLPTTNQLLAEVLQSDLFLATDLPQPAPTERKRLPSDLPLFAQAGIDVDGD
ncbi:MAG: N-6 DNA methylase, partial [Anaerolineales bacterium]|nr:N-6 DNA methylase [Anaerolineales bacterium]